MWSKIQTAQLQNKGSSSTARNVLFLLGCAALLLLCTIYFEAKGAYITTSMSQYNEKDVKVQKQKHLMYKVSDFVGTVGGLFTDKLSEETENRNDDKDEFISADHRGLGAKFDRMCGYWVDEVQKWKKLASRNNYEKRFYANQARSGTGDRLAGAFTAFSYAVRRGEVLDLSWSHIDSVFSPSVLVENDPPLINLNGKVDKLPYGNCKDGSYYQCSIARHEKDKCPVYNRACLQAEDCQKLVDRYGEELTMAHVLGCPMRLMFQPTEEFMNHEISWYIDGKTVNGTLSEVVQEMKQYETIALHLRLGDTFMKHSVDGDPENGKERNAIKKSEFCMAKVDKYVVNKTSSRSSGKSKPIKWIIASDDVRIRNYFTEEHPEKVVILQSRPRHVTSLREKKMGVEGAIASTRDLFAEWYLLGVADHMVTNNAHNFGTSAFSRSAWIYNLKSQYYEIVLSHPGNCKMKEYKYQGAVSHVSKVCTTPGGNELEQSHMLDNIL